MSPATTSTESTTDAESAAGERPLRADARRNREAVLEAARDLFAESGSEAQIDDIARAAGVGVGTVYRHFPTKDDLIAALVDKRFQRLEEKARECLAHADPWQGFCEFMRYSVQVQADDRALSEVMAERPEMIRGAVEGSGMWEPMSALVKRAQKAKKLRADARVEDVPTLICGVGSVTQAGETPGAIGWDRLLAIIIDGLRAPGGSKLPPLSPNAPAPPSRKRRAA